MRNADRISGIFWLCFALLFIAKSYQLGPGTLRQPGPGFLFLWINIALGMMSLSVLIRGWLGKKSEESAVFGRQNLTRVIFVLISLFLYVLLLEILGFILTTLLLLIFLLGIIEKKGWFFAVSVSAVVTAIAYLVFEVWLMSQLPKGFGGI
ncbi:MAG: tripartite tricarboxylate transporter TctB family protein [Deltaproteobacteria bacterium]|nr:tripartite tricarboxylate transporter TctB family protein [Deltaproteobacteria bacterium]